VFSFEYPYVLALIIAVFACLFFCQEKKLSIYFPYSENLKTLVTGVTTECISGGFAVVKIKIFKYF
jgi:hypothetical protein